MAALNAGYTTLQQLRTPDEYRGRVFGATMTGFGGAMILGALLASTLGDVVGIIPIIALQGAIHVVAGPLLLARLRADTPTCARDRRTPGAEIRTGGA